MIWRDKFLVYDKIIRGRNIILRAVQVDDAEFILKIRNDPEKSKYIHKVSDNLDNQIAWIRKQQDREGDYYFILENFEGRSVGTIGLSSIENGVGETSRFVSYGNPLENVEANLLVTDFAFYEMKLSLIRGYIGVNNIEVINLQKKFGYIFEDKTEKVDGMEVVFAGLKKADYEKKRSKIIKIIERVSV